MFALVCVLFSCSNRTAVLCVMATGLSSSVAASARLHAQGNPSFCQCLERSLASPRGTGSVLDGDTMARRNVGAERRGPVVLWSGGINWGHFHGHFATADDTRSINTLLAAEQQRQTWSLM